MQEPGGEWPYEGVYRVQQQIPLGYRVGGTALVADTLLHAAPEAAAARAAVAKAVPFILQGLTDPLLATSTADAYDVRIWGQICALEFFCHLRTAGRAEGNAAAVDQAVPGLVRTILAEELPGGGWNYANRRKPASFVTAPVLQALLLARSQGAEVPDEVFDRGRQALEKGRTPAGAFQYSGAAGQDALPGSIARSALCETTLTLLGGGSVDAVRQAVKAFHQHWEELEKRRQKTGTHEGPYLIAPYYFYFGHRYLAQAITLLPPAERAAERARLRQLLLRTRDADGTWNDRVFPRSRAYGTAMATVVLLGDRGPLPPKRPAKAP
jgi:hypothetical protein